MKKKIIYFLTAFFFAVCVYLFYSKQLIGFGWLIVAVFLLIESITISRNTTEIKIKIKKVTDISTTTIHLIGEDVVYFSCYYKTGFKTGTKLFMTEGGKPFICPDVSVKIEDDGDPIIFIKDTILLSPKDVRKIVDKTSLSPFRQKIKVKTYAMT